MTILSLLLFCRHSVYSRWFSSRYVIAAMLVDENKRFLNISPFVRPPAIVHCSIVFSVARDWLQTTYFQQITLQVDW